MGIDRRDFLRRGAAGLAALDGVYEQWVKG